MAMTKEEILKDLRNHAGEIKVSLATVDLAVHSLVVGSRTEVPSEINSYKGLLDFAKGKLDEMKTILGQWPPHAP